jgi:aspartyl-tRNA(Asn)/glutamyl-tRNA(Gln) amidotransferase subunit B
MSRIPEGWEVVIGLETHTQLSTASKIFSGSPTQYGAPPNTQADAVDLALPGTLPVLNKHAVECAIKFGLAVNAKIAPRSIFARKNYFYPDLPKGYQISQYELPVVIGGEVKITVGDTEKTVQLTRAHLEEDAGKSLHEGMETSGVSGIDLNRAGTPLLEIVTEPCMNSAEEAVAYAKALHGIVTWIGICDGNMQEGSFRCDANVSVRRVGDPKLGTRAEIKNVNSFRFLERAIQYEVRRQIELIEDGGKVVQETRLYDSDRDETRSMRSKEDAMDYRYFPDPDLLPLKISQDWIASIKSAMPEMPASVRDRLTREHQISVYDATLISSNLFSVAFFESVLAAKWGMPQELDGRLLKFPGAKVIANWMIGELGPLLDRHDRDYAHTPISAPAFAALLTRLQSDFLSAKGAKEILNSTFGRNLVLEDLREALNEIARIESEKGLKQLSAANPKSVEEYKAGKEKALNALFGQVMKASNKTANPAQVTEILKRKLAQ